MHVFGRQAQSWPVSGVLVVGIRHHRIEAVIAAGQLDDHEDSVAGLKPAIRGRDAIDTVRHSRSK
ncbi:MAG: hypothetical protein ACYTE3_28380 [Planctomycetota bacterium]